MPPLPPSPDQLLNLIDVLRTRHGYRISTQQAMTAQDMILALTAHGQAPNDPERLRSFLAPILCKTPQEQRDFRRHFEQWLNPTGEESTELRDTTSTIGMTPKTTRWRTPILILVGLALSTAAVWYAQRRLSLPPPLTRQVVNEEQRPLADAAVSFDGQTIKADAQGYFTIPAEQLTNKAELEVRKEGYVTASYRYERGNESAIPTRIQLRVQTKNTPTPTPLPTPVSPSDKPPKSGLPFWLIAVVAGLPLLAYALWWWRRKRRIAQLERRLADHLPQLENLDVRQIGQQLFRGVAFRRAAQALRRRRPIGSRDLNLTATVKATVHKAGMFTPVFATRSLLPEYLILIDRRSALDQQARYLEEIARRMADDNVFVEVFYYHHDPRLCHPKNPTELPLTLPELTARYPDHHLLLFGDGHGLISPLNGFPQPWLELFTPWSQRAILTPEPITQWDNREYSLRAKGFLLQPATPQGLAALAESFQTGNVREVVEDGWPLPYPEGLRGNDRRWVENTPPEPREISRLSAQLRAYLGISGYDWLRACALYPELNWNLTLLLGQRLVTFPDREALLLALSRLPWFRYGRVPDWLRTELLQYLPSEREQAIREALEEVLHHATLAPQAEEALSLSAQTVATQTTGRSPEEFVFLSFLTGRLSHLATRAPGFLTRLLFQQGQTSLGLRPSSMFACAVFLCFTSLLAMQLWAGSTPNQTEVGTNRPPTPELTPTIATPLPTASGSNPTPRASASLPSNGEGTSPKRENAVRLPSSPTLPPTVTPPVAKESPVTLPTISQPTRSYSAPGTDLGSNIAINRTGEENSDALPPTPRPTTTPTSPPSQACNEGIRNQYDGYTIEDINSSEPGRERELMQLKSALREGGNFTYAGLNQWLAEIRRYYEGRASSSSSQSAPRRVGISACVEVVKGGKCQRCIKLTLDINEQKAPASNSSKPD